MCKFRISHNYFLSLTSSCNAFHGCNVCYIFIGKKPRLPDTPHLRSLLPDIGWDGDKERVRNCSMNLVKKARIKQRQSIMLRLKSSEGGKRKSNSATCKATSILYQQQLQKYVDEPWTRALIFSEGVGGKGTNSLDNFDIFYLN